MKARILALVLSVLTGVGFGLIYNASGAKADDWNMAACAYEQSWIKECSETWIVPAPNIAYRVRKGDTLWRIAFHAYNGNGHEWKRIAAANHIVGTTIRVGQWLIIPHALRSPRDGSWIYPKKEGRK